jgi:hypothetical protein
MTGLETRKIHLKRIAHVYYTHVNIENANKFLLDFGLSVVQKEGSKTYYRGYGTEPFLVCTEQGPEDKFGGAAFAVETLEDLEVAAKTLPDATPVHDLDSPGGGKRVTFYDPNDKFPFHLVFGQTPVEMSDSFPELRYNFPTHKHRPVNKTQRFEKGPAPIHKLGHFGLCVTKYQEAFDFYLSRFNFRASEIVHGEDGVNHTTFLRLDRGDEMVDHHCFFFFEGPKFHVHHSSFEVHDFDSQLLGHDWLRHKGYENCWGVGRHVMGSQIFDYWFDPSKFILEHYVDGDLIDDKTPTSRTKAGPDSLYVWGMLCSEFCCIAKFVLMCLGPDLPPTFLQ